MPANKTPRAAILRAMFKASESDVIVPNDLYWRTPVPGTVTVPPMRGYATGRCVDEANVRRETEEARRLMEQMK